MTKYATSAPLLLSLLLGGCTIGPDYTRPELSVPETFRDANGSALLETRWWKNFDDPKLSAAVEEALEANHDLRSAQAQVDILLGRFDQAKSYLYPQIDGGGSMKRTGVTNSTGYLQREGVTSVYAASLSLSSYELDLFGKVRRANEAARALLLSSEYGRQTLRLSTASAVAASYIRLSSLEGQIGLAQENLRASSDIEHHSALKYRHGTIDESVYLQSLSEMENAHATLSQLQGAKIAEEAVFNLLCGKNPSTAATAPLDAIRIPELPAALPGSVLLNRPDIAAAEQELIAANAQIGIARAAYFPSIKLTGMLGIQSLELSDFVSDPTRVWEILPSVSVPIFTAGRIAGEIKSAEAERSRTIAQYQKAVVSAFNDADSAIGQNAKAREQLGYQNTRSEAIEKAFAQARLRYEVGAISYSDMLLVQQQWLQARQNLLIARQNALTASVNLYKALGGGWDGSSELPDPDYLPAGR